MVGVDAARRREEADVIVRHVVGGAVYWWVSRAYAFHALRLDGTGVFETVFLPGRHPLRIRRAGVRVSAFRAAARCRS